MFRMELITFPVTFPSCPTSVEHSVEQYKQYTAVFILLLLPVSKAKNFLRSTFFSIQTASSFRLFKAGEKKKLDLHANIPLVPASRQGL